MWLSLKKRLFAAFIAIILICIVAIWACLDTGGVPVLNYHQINDRDHNSLTVSTTEFDQQMKYLKDNGYHTITPAELMDWAQNGTPLPDKPVVITLDDGYIDNYEEAYPILKKYNLKATIFVITDFVGVYPNYLTWDTISEMHQSGLIDIESHTLSHEELNKAPSTEELDKQLKESRKALEWRLNKTVDFIAYPCGSDSPEVLERTKLAGYRGAFTVDYGLVQQDERAYDMDRVPIFGCMPNEMRRFKARLRLTRIFAPLSKLQRNLYDSGHDKLANLIPVP